MSTQEHKCYSCGDWFPLDDLTIRNWTDEGEHRNGLFCATCKDHNPCDTRPDLVELMAQMQKLHKSDPWLLFNLCEYEMLTLKRNPIVKQKLKAFDEAINRRIDAIKGRDYHEGTQAHRSTG